MNYNTQMAFNQAILTAENVERLNKKEYLANLEKALEEMKKNPLMVMMYDEKTKEKS